MQVGEQDDLAFDLAFTEALGGASIEDDGTVAKDDAAPADQAPIDEGISDEPQGAEPVAATPSSAQDGEEPSPAPAFNAEYEEMKRANEALTAQLAELKKPKAEAPPAPVEQKAADIKPDVEFGKFAEEWPEVAKMMTAREDALKSQIKELMQELVAPVKQELLTAIQPVVQSHQQTEEDRFLNTIKSQHPDALELLSEVDKWAATLPAYAKVGVDHALTKGTAEDVIALYNTFKKETGRTQQAPAPALDEVTKKRMAKMGAVSASRPASPTAQADVNDYDGAFAQAAADIK